MAADQKDTTVTEESTQQETVATKAKPAAASKKLCAEELIREFESAQQKNDLPEIYVGDTVRVGVRISEVGRLGSASLVRQSRGRPNASVFPEPVGALQHTSFPSIPSGMDSR